MHGRAAPWFHAVQWVWPCMLPPSTEKDEREVQERGSMLGVTLGILLVWLQNATGPVALAVESLTNEDLI